MPTPADKVQLLIGGALHDDWESYEVASDLMTPADAFNLVVGLPGGSMPARIVEAAAVELRVDGDLVLTGRIDDVDHDVAKRAHTLHISGRDGAAVLVDCSAPIFTARQATLAQIVTKLVSEFGIKSPIIDADQPLTREKINVEPGDSAWAALQNAAEANGLFPWFAPDGTLIIGGPDYTLPEVATLTLRRDGRGNNIERLSLRRSMARRYSQVTVYGQAHGTSTEQGKHDLKQTAYDKGMAAYRPHVVVDHEADNTAICLARARKLLADGRLHALELSATVSGHRINAPGMPGHGKLWQPGQRVHVFSEPHDLNGTYFLMARTFHGGRNVGRETTLSLVEDGAWVLDAHPHKRKHRRGKNSAAAQILDLATPA